MHPDLEPSAGTLATWLRELPDAASAPYDYAEFQRRALRRTRRPPQLAGERRLAGACVLLVAGLAVLARLGPFPGATEKAVTPAAAVYPAAGPGDEALSPGSGVGETPAREAALVRVGTRAALMGLEDHIAQLDDLLSVARGERDAQRLAALQQERARLLHSLQQVRYAESLADATPPEFP